MPDPPGGSDAADFVALSREAYGESDTTVYHTPEQVIAATEALVLGRITAVEPGRIVRDPSGDLLYETVTLRVDVDESMGGPLAGQVGEEVLVDRLITTGISIEEQVAAFQAALPAELSTLLGLRDFSDAVLTETGESVEHLTPSHEGQAIWSALAQGFVVRGGGDLALNAASAELLPVAMDAEGTSIQFDTLVEYVRDRAHLAAGGADWTGQSLPD